MKKFLFLFLTILVLTSCTPPIAIGSKNFTESYVLGEIARIHLRERLPALRDRIIHRRGMGGTIILWEALTSGTIDFYPDYTGTIQQQILKLKGEINLSKMRKELARHGIGMTKELGFNNTYALAMRRKVAERLKIKTISDLKKYPKLRLGFNHEFLKRKDGWEPLKKYYRLPFDNVRGINHTLSYVALIKGELDVKEAFSTDAKIAQYDLVTLEDDLRFFPQYKAVYLYRLDSPPDLIKALRELGGTIPQKKMVELNRQADKTRDYTLGALAYFPKEVQETIRSQKKSTLWKVLYWTAQHLFMVTISLLVAILIGLPLGIASSRPGWLSQAILGTTGVIYTIPSLALLAVLVGVPGLGTTAKTAMVALFLYSLLPIVRNTATGLQEIPKPLQESAIALGLEPMARMKKIYLPMASPTILAGIKTAAIINVGTATLAALIGAGGLGEPILSGLDLNDFNTILLGAIPVACLALLVQFFFEILDRLIIPKGLRLKKKMGG